LYEESLLRAAKLRERRKLEAYLDDDSSVFSADTASTHESSDYDSDEEDRILLVRSKRPSPRARRNTKKNSKSREKVLATRRSLSRNARAAHRSESAHKRAHSRKASRDKNTVTVRRRVKVLEYDSDGSLVSTGSTTSVLSEELLSTDSEVESDLDIAVRRGRHESISKLDSERVALQRLEKQLKRKESELKDKRVALERQLLLELTKAEEEAALASESDSEGSVIIIERHPRRSRSVTAKARARSLSRAASRRRKASQMRRRHLLNSR